MFEIRSAGHDSSIISVNLVNEGVRTSLLFGSNADQTEVWIDKEHISCTPTEHTPAIRIRNGTVIESGCIGKFKNYFESDTECHHVS